MFGYIRPYINELSENELDKFKCVYCSLCHTLKENYGNISRFVLNYDFVLLAILLWPAGFETECEKKRCMAHPIEKREVFSKSPPEIDMCAAYSVILAYWKVKDSINDEKFFGKIKPYFASLFLKKAYKKAAGEFNFFDKKVRDNLSELSLIEKRNEPSIDIPADKFATILSAAAENITGSEGRIKSEIFYQLGRWIYIIDAYNDLADDLKKNNYNPIAAKYNIVDISQFTDDIKNEIDITIEHSLTRLSSGFELMDKSYWTELLNNIIYFGMPSVYLSVKKGDFSAENNKME